MKTGFVIGNSLNPYYNLAVENELMDHAAYGMTILYLWQNEHTVVIGRNQDVYSECRVREFLGNEGIIARRKSGGGAVYHDLGNLNFSIINLEDDGDRMEYKGLIKNALEEFSIQSEYNGRNDITVGGFKISGNAAYSENGVICQHGTILIECDIEKMAFYLTPEENKLKRNKVSSVKSRVTNLKTLDSRISIKSMQETLIRALEAKEFVYELDADKVNRFKDFFAKDSWVYGGEK